MNSPEDEIPLPSEGVLSEKESAKQLREDSCRQYVEGMKELRDKLIHANAQLEAMSSALLIANKNLDVHKRDYRRGFEDGVRCFAWWKDGVEMVGTTGKTLAMALEQLEELYGFNPPTRKSSATDELQALVDKWNAHRPVGSLVDVKLDDDTIRRTQTRSEAWLMGGHTPVVAVDGIGGGYMLSRVRPVT